MSWYITPAASLAQLVATAMAADAGSANSRFRLYSTTRPADGAAIVDTPIAEIELAKPCYTVVGGVFALHAANPDGSLVAASGIPRWATWVAGNDALVAVGDVTDEAHGGQVKVSGGATPPGDNSPQLYAGGLVLLGTTSLT